MPHSFDGRVRPAHVGLALAALSAAAAVHAQSTLYVDAAAPAGGDGQHWSTALRDLQDALYLANLRPDRTQPITINIAQGVYTPDAGTHNPNLSFVVNSGVSLAGGFAGSLGMNPNENDPSRFVSVLSGDLLHNDAPGNSTRTDNSQVVLDIQSQPGSIDGLTVSGGLVAALCTGYGYFTISRCTFSGNVSSTLDPITYLSPGNQTAILALTYATLVDCTIADNNSTVLPLLNVSYCEFQRCTIAGNQNVHVPTNPGLTLGLGTLGSQCLLDSCLIAANTGDAGLDFQAYDLSLYNCTLADNRPSPGPILTGWAVSLYNCILSRNGAAGAGSPGPQVSVSNSVQIVSSLLDHGLADAVSGIHSVSGTNILSGNPLFANPAGPDADPLAWHNNDYRLAAGSPCIDHADTSSLAYLSTHLDRTGNAPIDDPSTPNLGLGPITYLDLGAFEFIPPTPPACRADFNNSGSLTPQDIFDFLSAWFALSPTADFNNSGTITAQDIFDFLTAWFTGC